MGRFVRSIKVAVQFDGDSMEFACKPMDRACAIKFQSFKRVPVLDDSGAPKLKDGAQLFTIGDDGTAYLLEQFEKHVESVTGARDADGNALDKSVVFGSAYFIGACSDAAGEWSVRSLSGN